MFIQIEETPNPQTLKFLPGFQIMDTGKTVDLSKDSENSIPPLAKTLFGIDGVEKVFFSDFFISVTKAEPLDWSILKPEILMEIMEYFSQHNRIIELTDDKNEHLNHEDIAEFFDPADIEIVNKIRMLIDDYVKPAVAQDGGYISFRGYEKGVVFVKLQGACSGCPSASVTLKQGVFNMLNYHVPEIISVEEIE